MPNLEPRIVLLSDLPGSWPRSFKLEPHPQPGRDDIVVSILLNTRVVSQASPTFIKLWRSPVSVSLVSRITMPAPELQDTASRKR